MKSEAACCGPAFIAPASFARSTSRDSRSASFLISSALSGLPSSTPPLMTRNGCALAKSRRPLAASTGSPLTNAIADGPTSSSVSCSTPASFAAILVSVFFTTAYLADSPSERRSSWSSATLRPRYSVSTAAFEVRNSSAISATAAALSGRAMGLLPAPFHALRSQWHRHRPQTSAHWAEVVNRSGSAPLRTGLSVGVLCIALAVFGISVRAACPLSRVAEACCLSSVQEFGCPVGPYKRNAPARARGDTNGRNSTTGNFRAYAGRPLPEPSGAPSGATPGDLWQVPRYVTNPHRSKSP